MSAHTGQPVHWEFVLHQGAEREWSWRRVGVDGAIEHKSKPHSTYGLAVEDAISSGFRPQEQHWLVTSKEWTTHFEPDESPVSLGPAGLVIQRPPLDERAIKLQRLRSEIRSRALVRPPLVDDPIAAIMRYVSTQRNSPENRTLVKVAAAVVRSGDFDEADVSLLGQESLGLLDALIERTIR